MYNVCRLQQKCKFNSDVADNVKVSTLLTNFCNQSATDSHIFFQSACKFGSWGVSKINLLLCLSMVFVQLYVQLPKILFQFWFKLWSRLSHQILIIFTPQILTETPIVFCVLWTLDWTKWKWNVSFCWDLVLCFLFVSDLEF